MSCTSRTSQPPAALRITSRGTPAASASAIAAHHRVSAPLRKRVAVSNAVVRSCCRFLRSSGGPSSRPEYPHLPAAELSRTPRAPTRTFLTAVVTSMFVEEEQRVHRAESEDAERAYQDEMRHLLEDVSSRLSTVETVLRDMQGQRR